MVTIEPFDPATERPISLAEAAGILPPLRPGKTVHRDTIRNWVVRGVRPGVARDRDQRVRLQAVQIGHRLFTSRQAILRFIDRLTNPDQPPSEEREARAAAHEAAVHKLKAAGF